MDSSHCIANSVDEIRPFEWLTSASSLRPIFDDCVAHQSSYTRCALHIGCGSSTVGEYLIEELGYDHVANVDKDGAILRQMDARWRARHPNDDRLSFCEMDLVKHRIPYASGYFDVVIDKSTLDCTLCSDEATAALLCQVYNSLNAQHGVYIVISFHHVDLLLPLLRDCPGTDWEVSHQVIHREVEDIIGNCSNKNVTRQAKDAISSETNEESAWATGSFQPTEGYRTTVNVLICRRDGSISEAELDREQVCRHVHETNDEWFQSHNPMLTGARRDELQSLFGNRSLDLESCYDVLFTEAEREHLTFAHFMEDWHAFLETRPLIARDCMSFETAVDFLDEMQ